MKRLSVILFLLVAMALGLSAQPSCGGRPLSVRKAMPRLHDVCLLPSRQQLAQSGFCGLAGSADAFAAPIATGYNPCNSGQWETIGDTNVWRLVVSSPNAFSLNVLFADFFIPEGAQLFLYGADTTEVLGAYTAENNAPLLPTPPVSGDVIVVEYNEPVNADFQGFFNIVQVAHDFKGAFADEPTPGACQVGLTDEQKSEWGNERRAVCRILIGGTTLCTGTLLATADRSFEPYVLTARHCIYSEKQAQSSIFFFNYDDYDIPEKQSVAGSTLVAAKDNDEGFLDFSLVRLNNSIPDYYNVYYAGWDVSGTMPRGGVCLHHPEGGSVAIAVDGDSLSVTSYRNFDGNTFFNVAEWDEGATEQGSSGAPLFDANHRVVGLLAGGDSDCDYPMNDYFQMLSVCYDRYQFDSLQLAHWLNPDGQPITAIDGNAGRTSAIGLKTVAAQVSVYPNPATTEIRLTAENEPIAAVGLTDLEGRAVMSERFGCQKNVVLNVGRLPSGMYVCSVKFANGDITKLLIIRN
ncbi:MAG: trypsin-like peptidase domain-containing protein [Salinivirgaceae bacterium]|nr:trypsin-like peptidase domain-containing protein [Salinivirgaceae bacterium]